ncbi:galactose-proton symport of transport system [Klebsiella pneumoniae]|uniref:Galactose-proton symport of transport system n=1 Tax=Klebsiella pneumoniae TaxID=573 RepID=A0A377W3V5_KLEPN|nr:galactose-proton symport of transport system [Klebsiella pneumoniae]
MLSAAAPDITTLLIARALLGYAVGGASVTAPTFISEVAPTEMRGKLTGLNEVAIVIGQLAAFAINAIIGIIWGHLPDVWALYAAGTSDSGHLPVRWHVARAGKARAG